MNLKCSGLLFVLIVLIEAISAELPVNTTNAKQTNEGLLVVQPTTDKPLPEVTEVVNTSAVVHKLMKDLTTAPVPTPVPTTPPTPPPTTPPTTTQAPTPAPSPTPPPLPDKGNWVIRNDTTNTTCIIAEMAMQLNITYPGFSKDQCSDLLNVPKNAMSTGTCDNSTQSMTISWGPGHRLVINFKANKTAKTFHVSDLSLTVNATVLKDAKVLPNNTLWSLTNKSSEFTTPLDMSYKCNKEQDLKFESGDPKLSAVLSLRDTQIEAFMNKTKAEFGAAQDCDGFDTPDIVPIAVGCALAILVLVVLVAYLIGRKRSQNRGYLSITTAED